MDIGTVPCVLIRDFCNTSCLTCSGTNSSLCLSCQSFLTLTAGSCLCPTELFYYFETNLCLSCQTYLVGCLECTNDMACTLCDSSKGFSLGPGGRCVCPSNYSVVTESCVDCLTTCNCAGVHWRDGVVGGVCEATCGDGLLITGSEECDDGNAVGGDGCNSSCQI